MNEMNNENQVEAEEIVVDVEDTPVAEEPVIETATPAPPLPDELAAASVPTAYRHLWPLPSAPSDQPACAGRGC